MGLRYDRTFIPTAGATREQQYGRRHGLQSRRLYYPEDRAALRRAKKAPCVSCAGWRADRVACRRTSRFSPDRKATDRPRTFQPRLGFAYAWDRRPSFGDRPVSCFDNYSGVNAVAKELHRLHFGPALGFNRDNLNYPSAAQSDALPGQLPTRFRPRFSPLADSLHSDSLLGRSSLAKRLLSSWNFGFPKQQLNPPVLLTRTTVGSGSHRTTIGVPLHTCLLLRARNFKGTDAPKFPYYADSYFLGQKLGYAKLSCAANFIERRCPRGLAFTVSYTYSKPSTPDRPVLWWLEGNSIQNPYEHACPTASISVSDLHSRIWS